MSYTRQQVEAASATVHGNAPTNEKDLMAARAVVQWAANNGYTFTTRGKITAAPGPQTITVDGQPLYFYVPIPFYDGKVLKCGGMVSDQNREWFKQENPGAVEVVGYLGDRINADDHNAFAG